MKRSQRDARPAAAAPSSSRARASESPAPPLYRDDAEPLAFFRSHWPLLIVLGAAALVRVVQYFIARASDPSFGFCLKGVDTYTYDQWAQAILNGDWFSAKDGRGIFYYGPVYPYFLALVYGICGHRYGAAHAAQYAVGVLTAGVAFLGLGQWFSRRVAFVAALALALCPTTLYYEGTLLSSSLDFFLTALFLWAFGAACVRLAGGGRQPEEGESQTVPPSPPRTSVLLALAWLLAGLSLGFAAIQRANILLCAGGVLAWLALWARHGANGRAPLRLRAALGALFLAGTLLGVSPATWHNVRFGHQWVLVTSNGPNLFYMGNAHDASGTFDYPPSFQDVQDETKIVNLARGGKADDAQAQAAQLAKRSPGDPRWEDLLKRLRAGTITKDSPPVSMGHELASDLAAHPGAWIALLAKKVYLFWAGYDPPDNFSYDLFRRFSPLLRWNPLGFGLIAPLALIGMLLSARAWRRVAGLHGFVWTFCASVALVFVVGRYRLPVVYALAGFASLAAWRAWAWARGGHAGRAAGVVAGAVVAGLMLSAYAVYPLRIRANDYSMAATYFTKAGRPADAAALLAGAEAHYSAGGAAGGAASASQYGAGAMTESDRERAMALHVVRDSEARLLAQEKRWAEAEVVLRRIMPDGMMNADEAEMLIVALAQQGKLDEARRLAADMQRRAPQDTRWAGWVAKLGGAGAQPAP